MINSEVIKANVSNSKEIAAGLTIPEKYTGPQGEQGYSAYEIAVQNGFEGTEEEWLESLKGQDGTVAFSDLTEEQKASLRGADGAPGRDGKDGRDGQDAVSAINPRGNYDPAATYNRNDYVTYTENGNAYTCMVDGTTGISPLDTSAWQILALRGADGPAGINGKDGAPGAQGLPGVSPTVSYEIKNGDIWMTVTDVTGPHTAVLPKGQSPYLQVTPITGGYTLTIVNPDSSDPINIDVKDGAPGKDGIQGPPGKDSTVPGPQGEPGTKGDDGFSPTVTITAIEGGHRVSITDANGTQNFDVMDGQDATSGTTNPTWVGYTHQQAQLSGNLVDVVSIVDNDKCSVVPEIGSYGLVIAEGADETQRYVMYCQAVAPSPGHEIEGTTTIRIKYALPVSGGGTVDLSDYYTKSEVDGKIADYLFCYSSYPPSVEIAAGITKSVITDYFIGATPTPGSFGIMIYYQGANRYLIDFKVISTDAEVTDVQFMSEPVQINTPDMTQYYTKSEVYNKSQVDNKIADISLTPGPAGTPGQDGVTPHIGENGNWFIGTTDTGTAATGANGQDGATGLSALMLNATFTSTPVTNTNYLINRTWLNREPVAGEVISGTITDDKGVVFWAVGKIIIATSSPYNAKFTEITKITGPTGAKGNDGAPGAKGDPGDTYTITAADYDAIADVVLTKIPSSEGVSY